MFNFKELEKRYTTDSTFNKATNLFRQLTEQYGFLPSELREAAFLAQYMFEMDTVERVVRTKEEWEQLAQLRVRMKEMINLDYDKLAEALK